MSTTPVAASEAVVPVDRRDEILAELTDPNKMTTQTLKLLQETICKGGSPEEIKLFGVVCGRTKLDPFTKQIHFVKRYDSQLQKEVAAHQVGIDGFRVISLRSGKDRGMTGPLWCGVDGQWVEVWTSSEPPFAAKVGLRVEGFPDPVWAIARWKAYAQKKRDGGYTHMWATRDAEMLAKCAEALCRRIAFPNDLSGLYTEEEFGDDERPVEHTKSRVTEELKRDAVIRESASKSVAAVIEVAETAGEAPKEQDAATDDTPAEEPESEGRDPRSAADKAEVLAQGSVDDMMVTLAALRQASGGKRAFYETITKEGKKPRVALVDGALLIAAGQIKNGAPVKAWLDSLKASDRAWGLMCGEIIRVAKDLGVEVVR